MKGIIDDRALWASNVSFLNDRKELIHGLVEAAKVANDFSSHNSYGTWTKALSSAIGRLKKGTIPNTYAVCFCQSPDLLSQWRGYALGEQGVSIVFDRNTLTDILEESRANMYPVIYGRLKAKGQITKDLSDRLDELDEEVQLIGSFNEIEKRKKVESILSRLLPQFKHYGFREEMEWRFVVQHVHVRPGVCFRAAKNVMIPYLILPIGNEGDPLPISKIKIGPGRDQSLTKKSIELYLEQKGQEHIKVFVSSIPYRV